MYLALSESWVNVISEGGFFTNTLTGFACRGTGTLITVPLFSFARMSMAAMNSSFDVALRRLVADCLKDLPVTSGPGK